MASAQAWTGESNRYRIIVDIDSLLHLLYTVVVAAEEIAQDNM